jgi:hypothetical protein
MTVIIYYRRYLKIKALISANGFRQGALNI